MREHQSYVEFCLGTYAALLVDCAAQYPALAREFKRDFQRLSSAADSHGIRFFLDTMPSYRKHLDKCLDSGRLTSTTLFHFGTWYKGGTIPRLFRGLFLRVFDRNGTLRLEPDENAIFWLRQLLGVFRKLRMESSAKDRGDSVEAFITLDRSVRHGDLTWDSPDDFIPEDAAKLSFADDLVGHPQDDTLLPLGESRPDAPLLSPQLGEYIQRTADIFTSLLGVFNAIEWRPKHGPGAVSDSRFGEYKYSFKTWPDRLDRVFHYDTFACANWSLLADSIDVQDSLAGMLHEHPAKLCAVPKTIKTPRLIACEPTSLQWCQQIVKDYLYTRVRETVLSQFIDFRRQDLNGHLASVASHDQTLATIDLSAASDRISCWHVERLFRRSPSLLHALQASRSLWISQDIDERSPSHILLRKYSTMGNATTFPVQSIFFTTIAVACVLYARQLPVSLKSIGSLGRQQVRVFGDDIIIPKDVAGLLVDTLENLQLKVNADKSFWTGKFRESCGVDAYNGNNVTTISILDVPRRSCPGSIVSTVDVFNNLCDKGLVTAARYIQKIARPLVHDKIREVKHGSGLFGWSDLFGSVVPGLRTRYNKALQVREVYALRVRTREERSLPKESSGLLQYFTEAPKVITSNVSSLGYLTQRPRVKLSLGWTPC